MASGFWHFTFCWRRRLFKHKHIDIDSKPTPLECVCETRCLWCSPQSRACFMETRNTRMYVSSRGLCHVCVPARNIAKNSWKLLNAVLEQHQQHFSSLATAGTRLSPGLRWSVPDSLAQYLLSVTRPRLLSSPLSCSAGGRREEGWRWMKVRDTISHFFPTYFKTGAVNNWWCRFQSVKYIWFIFLARWKTSIYIFFISLNFQRIVWCFERKGGKRGFHAMRSLKSHSAR